MIRHIHRPHGYKSGKRLGDIMLSFPFSPQDMEALKRSLAVIESKMAQAQSWLKDPHGLPGKWIISAEAGRFPGVVMLLHPQEILVRLPSV